MFSQIFVKDFSATIHYRCLKFLHILCLDMQYGGIHFCAKQTLTSCFMLSLLICSLNFQTTFLKRIFSINYSQMLEILTNCLFRHAILCDLFLNLSEAYFVLNDDFVYLKHTFLNTFFASALLAVIK